MYSYQKNQNLKLIRGFTLIEVMVVVVIIGMLAGLVGVNVFSRLEKAKIQSATTQMYNISQALDNFKLDNGFYPTTEQGLDALVNKPSFGKQAKAYPDGGYLKQRSVPRDPWDESYSYLSPGINNPNSYDIWSMGPDGEEGTGDDINNWSSGSQEEG